MTWLYNSRPIVQRVLALFFGVIFLLILISICLVTVRSANSLVEENIEKRELLGRLSAIAELKPDLENSKVSGGVYEAIFLNGETVASAGANLQAVVEKYATSNKVQVSSITNLPVKQQSDIELIGLRVILVGALKQVHAVIFEVETAVPPLIIGDISIQGSQNTNKNVEPRVTVSIEIFGAKKPDLEDRTAG
ncbi:MAG: type II secretion system protein GspM [Chloroflexota bacterium]